MKVHVDSWRGNVRLIDSDSLLTPELKSEILSMVNESLDHARRVSDERKIRPAVSVRQETTWGR